MTGCAHLAAMVALRRELDEVTAYAGVLKGALAAQGLETNARPGAWATLLTPQERALVGVLLGAYPRVVGAGRLVDCLPGHDHAVVRGEELAPVLVCRIRKKLGADAILTVRGIGFSLGRALYDVIQAPETPVVLTP